MPDELLRLDPEKFALVRLLAGEFEARDAYLEAPGPQAIGPVLLDHVAGTAVPEFDRYAISHGWELELKIGFAAKGIRAFTVCIYRQRENTFSAPEIDLAEALAKQLGLAMETSRLAEEVRR